MTNDTLPTTNNKKIYKYILIGLILLLGVLVFKELTPFFSGFLGAATLYIILKDQMIYLTEQKKWKKSLAAASLVIEALLFFLIPLTLFGILIVNAFSDVHIDTGVIIAQVEKYIRMAEQETGIKILTSGNLSFIPKIGTNLLYFLGGGIYSFIMNAIVVLFLLYYMLLKHKQMETAIRELLPFNEQNKQILGEETKLIIKANAIGIPLLGALQGLVAYIGYSIFGINNPILYAVLTAFATVLPIIGTAIIWLPLSIAFMVSGQVSEGIFLALYGNFIIGGVDNVARLFLQKILADIHPLITIFGVFIGIPMFGFWGVIFGPLILSLLMLFINMYRYEYVSGSKALPRVTTKMEPHIPSFKKKNKKKEEKEESNNEEDNKKKDE